MLQFEHRLSVLYLVIALCGFAVVPDKLTPLILAWVYFNVGVEFYLHRVIGHRQVDLPRWAEFIAFLFALPTHTGSTIIWGMYHYVHHKYSDKPKDWLSPKVNPRWKVILYLTAPAEQDRYSFEVVRYSNIGVLKSRWHGLAHEYYYPIFLTPIALLWAIGGFNAALTWYIIPGAFAVLFLGIFSVAAHSSGYRLYDDTGEKSTNVWWLWPLTPGMVWHNTHHKYQRLANLQKRWWEVDLIYWVLCRPFEKRAAA